MMRLRAFPLLAALLLVAASAHATQIVTLHAQGATTRSKVCSGGLITCSVNGDCPSGQTCLSGISCLKKTQPLQQFPLATVECAASGIQEAWWQFMMPPDADSTWEANITFHSSASSGNVCWKASITVILDGQGVDISSAPASTNIATVSSALSLPANSERTSTTASFAPFRIATDGDGTGSCSDTNCRERLALFHLVRDTSCVGNASGVADIDEVKLTY